MINTSNECLSGAGQNAPDTQKNGVATVTCHPENNLQINAQIISDSAFRLEGYTAFFTACLKRFIFYFAHSLTWLG